MSTSESEFHDPALKQAICRCWASDCASAALRARIEMVIRTGSDQAVISKPVSRRINPFAWAVWPTAVAALLMVCFGIFWLTTNHTRALPLALEQNLIHTHDHCCSEKNHQHLPVGKNDDQGIVRVLHEKLNQPVVMYRPEGAGWVFHGASVCPVGNTPSGHLVFNNGKDNLSIFSLPKSLVPNSADGTQFSAVVDQHRIVGFVKDGALFCLVSSGPDDGLSVQRMEQMEARMHPSVALAVTPSDESFVTELLRPAP